MGGILGPRVFSFLASSLVNFGCVVWCRDYRIARRGVGLRGIGFFISGAGGCNVVIFTL